MAVRKETTDDGGGGDNKRKRDEQQGQGQGGGKPPGGFNARGVPPGKSPVRLYVAGMPADVTEEVVKTVFRAHGGIKSVFLLRPRDGEESQPRRGIVEFESADAAAAAKSAVHLTAAFHDGGVVGFSASQH
jgi:hypothetical protein